MLKQKAKETARRMLKEFLEQNGYRKTPERFAILDEIYSRDGHFQIEALYNSMNEKNYHVTRATIYNTLDILLGSKLVVKHQFGKNVAYYEKTYPISKHDHIIDLKTGKILEFYDPRIKEIIKEVCGKNNFKFSHHALYIYGEEVPDKQLAIFKSV
jgi:Fur family transcriptional regulator, ferric uptake regulator